MIHFVELALLGLCLLNHGVTVRAGLYNLFPLKVFDETIKREKLGIDESNKAYTSLPNLEPKEGLLT